MQNNYNIIAEGYSLNELSKLTQIGLGTWKNRAKADLDNLIVIEDGKVETVLIVNDAKSLVGKYGEDAKDIEGCKREGFLASRIPNVAALILDLRERNSNLQQSNNATTVELKRCNSSMQALQQDYDSNVALLQQRSETIAALEQQLEETKNELDSTQLSGSSKSSQVDNLRTKLDEANKSIEQMCIAYNVEKDEIVAAFKKQLSDAKASKKKLAKWLIARIEKKYKDQRSETERIADKRLSWVLTLLTIVTVSVTVVSCMSMFGVGDIYHGFMGAAVSSAFILTAIANSMIQQSNTSNLKKGASGGLMVMMGAAAYYMHHNTFSKVFQDEANGWFAIGLATFFILMEIASIWFRRK